MVENAISLRIPEVKTNMLNALGAKSNNLRILNHNK